MKKVFTKAVSFICAISLLVACVVTASIPQAFAAEDGFDYSGVETGEWLYDFKAFTGTDDEEPAFFVMNESADDLNGVFTGAGNTDGNKSYFDKDGLHVFSNYNDGAGSMQNYTDTSGNHLCRRVLLWDYDYAKDIINWEKNGEYGIFPNVAGDRNCHASWAVGADIPNRLGLVTLDDGLYAVTMKFRVASMNTATTRVDINIGVYNDSSLPSFASDVYTIHRNGYMLDYTTVYNPSDEWMYYTAIIDGNRFKGNGKNSIALFISNDKYTADGTYNQIDIEYVSVERYYDSINGEFGARFYNYTDKNGNSNTDAADIDGKAYILGSGGGSPESTITLPEVINGEEGKTFKMWKTKHTYFPPRYKEVWDNGYGGYAGDKYQITSLSNANIRYFEACYLTEDAPADTKPVVYNFDLENLYKNKRKLANGAMISGDIGTEGTIAFNLKYTADGLSFKSNGGSGKLPESNSESSLHSAQRLSFYTGLGADAATWDGNYVTFKYGYTYKFSMVYKAENVDSTGSQIALASIVNDEYAVSKWAPTRLLKTWSAQKDTNGWVHVTYFFTADEYSAGNVATLAIQTKEGVITIKEATIEESYGDVNGDVSTIYFADNTGNPSNPFSGFVGDTHGTLPTPELFGYEFVEWCTDKTLTEKYTGTTFPKNDITLYAKWNSVPTVFTFDKINLEERGIVSSVTFDQIKDGDNYVMKYSLTKADYDANSELAQFSTPRRLSLNDGNWNHYMLTAGVPYTVTLRYKVLSVEEPGYISLTTSSQLKIWANYTENVGNGQFYGEPTDDWKTMEFTFTPKAHPDDDKATYLNISINGMAVILLDDVTVIAHEARANYYGTLIRFDTGDASTIDPICGEPGEKVKLPTPSKNGYYFGGWYFDSELTKPFTESVIGDEDITVYAKWLLGKYNEGFENYREVDKMMNFASGWIFYNDTIPGYDVANVKSGKTSLMRNSTTSGARAFSIMRKEDTALSIGEQYTLSFYIKPTNVDDVAQVINMISISAPSAHNIARKTENICDFNGLTVGEWNLVSYTFTASAPYIGLSVANSNEFYIDDISVTLNGYSGVATGEDTTGVNIAVLLAIVFAMGAVAVAGGYVFKKAR